MSYKSGDKVVIISQRGITWNQDGEMDIWQGKVMTIDNIRFYHSWEIHEIHNG